MFGGLFTVRDGPNGYEEYNDLTEFSRAYGFHDPNPALLALPYEMESLCEGMMIYTLEEGQDTMASIWGRRRDRCRGAIVASIAKSTGVESRGADNDLICKPISEL